MINNMLCDTVKSSLHSTLVCQSISENEIKVRTSLIYPDGTLIDVYILTGINGYTITDFGDTISWLKLQSVNTYISVYKREITRNICKTLGIEIFDEQLYIRSVPETKLGMFIFRLIQAIVQITQLSDIQ